MFEEDLRGLRSLPPPVRVESAAPTATGIELATMGVGVPGTAVSVRRQTIDEKGPSRRGALDESLVRKTLARV